MIVRHAWFASICAVITALIAMVLAVDGEGSLALAPLRRLRDESRATVAFRAQTALLTWRPWKSTDLATERQTVEARARDMGFQAVAVSSFPPEKIVLKADRSPSADEIARLTTPDILCMYLLPQLGHPPCNKGAKWKLAMDADSNEFIVDARTGDKVGNAELNRELFGRRPDVATEEFVRNFRADISPDGYPHIVFELKTAPALRFARIARSHIHEYLGIFLDRHIVAVPTISGPILGTGEIEGNFTLDRARDLAREMNVGALVVPLKVVRTHRGN
jgi:hypothetical protein